MQLEDLRIGNWYKAPIELNGSCEATIDIEKGSRHFIMTKEAMTIFLNLDSLIPFVEGIPLVFSHFIVDIDNYIPFSQVEDTGNGFQITTADGFDLTLKYVHELQDFFRALKK